MQALQARIGAPEAEPNVVPMIDVLLVLLIIFMVAQPLGRKVIPVQVPPPAPPVSTKTPAPQIVLELLRSGSYAINSQPVPKDQLDVQLRAIYEHRVAKVIFLKSAPNRIYQEVIEAADIARGAGVQIVGYVPSED